MWAQATLVAIALTGTVFLIWFLCGLLREGMPSICYWIIPRLERETSTVEARGHSFVGEDCGTPERERSDYYVQFLENEGHAKRCASGLIAINVRAASASPGWRSIQSKFVHFYHERGL